VYRVRGCVTAVSTNSNQEPLMAEERNTVELFERCSKSVVHITTTVQVQRSSGFSMDILDIPQGSGSGFVWDKDGHLVTNFHVIKDAQRAKVTMSDGKTYDAKLVGYEADKDLAVLKLVNGTREGSEGGTLSKMIPDSFRAQILRGIQHILPRILLVDRRARLGDVEAAPVPDRRRHHPEPPRGSEGIRHR